MTFLIKTKENESRDTYLDMRSLQELSTEFWYKRYCSPGEFSFDRAGAVSDITTVATYSAIVLAESGSADNIASVSFRKPAPWRNGTLKAHIDYTAVTSGGTYYVQGAFYITPAGSALNASDGSSWSTLSAISAAHELGQATFTTNPAINATDDHITFRLRRDGTDAADTSTQDLYVVGVTIEYVPNRESA